MFLSVLREGATFSAENKWVHNSSVVLEEIIDQDRTMASLHPQSLNVVRLTTIRTGGRVSFFYPWLKVGMNGAEATGSYQGNSFDAGIDARTGRLDTPGRRKRTVIERHPNTGVQIQGFAIPKWDELLSLAEKLSGMLAQFGYIGWDFALDSAGNWCVVEANYGGNQEGQWLYGRGLKGELEQILGWKPREAYWWSTK